MKTRVSILLAMISVLVLAGCGKDGAGPKNAEATSTEVHYYVLMNSIGALKITYKDNMGQVVVDDPVPAATVGVVWEKKFMFDGPVDALLTVELPESAPPDPVGAEFFIAINDQRVQKGTKFITKKNSMTLTYPPKKPGPP